uniref:Uncharacterized protein n=1 Tax=Geospiza parvula TaxID=87175 RepID=A0A8C3N7F9_GEOPR
VWVPPGTPARAGLRRLPRKADRVQAEERLLDDTLSPSVPGCILLQTALGASPELNTAWGWNSPSSKGCRASSAFVSTTKFPGTGAELPCPNKGLGKQEFVQLRSLCSSEDFSTPPREPSALGSTHGVCLLHPSIWQLRECAV